jgi:hypothetical protein
MYRNNSWSESRAKILKRTWAIAIWSNGSGSFSQRLTISTSWWIRTIFLGSRTSCPSSHRTRWHCFVPNSVNQIFSIQSINQNENNQIKRILSGSENVRKITNIIQIWEKEIRERVCSCVRARESAGERERERER